MREEFIEGLKADVKEPNYLDYYFFLEELRRVCEYLYKKPENKTKDAQRDNLKMVSKGKLPYTISITEIEMKDKVRRSGLPAYNHLHRVERYLYKMGFEIEYAIAALFHDILEDTPFNDKSIKRILNRVSNKYPGLSDFINEKRIDKIIDAIKILTKKDDFPKCYNVLKLETEHGDGFSIENYFGNIKIHQYKKDGQIIEEKGHPKSKLIDKDYLLCRLDDLEREEFDCYKEKMDKYKKYMEEYINKICESPIAMVVKIADRIDNLNDIASTDTAEWIEKYVLETIWISTILDKLKDSHILDDTKFNRLKDDLHNALENARNKINRKNQDEHLIA